MWVEGAAFNYFDLQMGRKPFSKAATSTHSHTMEQNMGLWGKHFITAQNQRGTAVISIPIEVVIHLLQRHSSAELNVGVKSSIISIVLKMYKMFYNK